MQTIVEPLKSKLQTGREMYRLVNEYNSDLKSVQVNVKGKNIPISELSFNDFFDLVKNIPYKQDKAPVEIVARPYYILQNRNKGADCKKKAILIGSYLQLHGVPFRFVASSKRPDKRIHHVFPQMLDNDEWRNVDATYSSYKPGQKKIVTKIEVLPE